MSLKYSRRVALSGIVALALGACTIPTPPAIQTQIVKETVEVVVTATSAGEATPAPAANGPGNLVIYSGRSESLVGPIIAQFKEASGINVEVRYGSTSEIAAALLEEGTNSPADVFFAQDPGGLGAIANADLFVPLPTEVISDVNPALKSPDNLWTGVTGRARVVVYNTDTVNPADLPADIFDFTDAKWKGKIGWVPTNASFQAMVTGMRTLWGEEKTRQWLEGMKANEPKVFEGNAPVVEAVAAGEIEIGFSNHYYLYRFLSEQGEGFKARNHFLTGEGPGSLLMVAGVGHLKNGKNPDNALKFISFLVSKVAQQYFASQTSEYPVINGVATPIGLTPLADLKTAPIKLTDLADLQGTTQLLSDVGVLP